MAPPKAMKFSKHTIEDDEKRETSASGRKHSIAKPKKVVLDQLDTTSTTGSLIPLTLHERMMRYFQKILEAREKLEIHENIDNRTINVTPKPINIEYKTDGYRKLTRKYSGLQVTEGDVTSFKSFTSCIMKSRSSRGVGFHVSLEEIINGIGSERMLLDGPLSPTHSLLRVNLDSSTSSISTGPGSITTKYQLPFIRIVLRKTELLLLYEQRSLTAVKNTEDGNFVEMDNKEYDYLTIGRGKIRRRSEAEAQTEDTLFKSREINTLELKIREMSTYVSYFEMFDTYKKLEGMEDVSLEDNVPKKLHISHSQTSEQQYAMIAQLPAFRLANVIIRRMLAGNVFEQGQRRFRNMLKVTRMANKVNYKYSLNTLFTIYPCRKDNVRRAVSDMSFCYSNSDILAVAYGIYSYQAAKLPDTGEVCIWSIKNPQDPERYYRYNVPVVAIEFSPYIPSLLAIGLFDGSVEVRDIAYETRPPIAISQRTSSPGVDPVLAIKWIKEGSGDQYEDIDPFITLSQDGSVTQFRIINSPFLAGFKLMNLERTQGSPEGLESAISSGDSPHQTNRCAQGLNITKHPKQMDIYYVLTDEGCIHKCSTNYQQHYLQVLKTHEGSVNAMDFSPWSPKLFLTCGNDWCIRIWMEGIFQPLLTLKNLCCPYQWAGWSRVHSTIIVAINRKQVEIWDLRRNILKPMSSTILCTSHNTLGIFSLDGHSIAIGTERGQVMVNALDDMPFPPYYQYENLEKAIYKAVCNYPELLIELKSIGYFGYADKGFVKPP